MSGFALIHLVTALLLSVTPVASGDDHVVVPGDTVSAIAKAYGVSVHDLIAANDLADPNVIFVGEVLRIPGIEQIHKVARGETLSSIAREYGTTVAELAAANGIVNINHIVAGTTITIALGSGADTALFEPAPVIGTGVTSYRVVRGDTVADIARRHVTTVARLVRLNDMADPNKLIAGTTILVPGEGFVCPVTDGRYINDWHFPRPGGRLHLGTDLFAAEGTPVFAPVSGDVEHRDGALGGLQFWLYGDDGNRYIGTHLSAFGQDGRVIAGTVIGYLGKTGNAKSTPPHLHFEINVGGEDINPYPTLVANGC